MNSKNCNAHLTHCYAFQVENQQKPSTIFFSGERRKCWEMLVPAKKKKITGRDSHGHQIESDAINKAIAINETIRERQNRKQ